MAGSRESFHQDCLESMSSVRPVNPAVHALMRHLVIGFNGFLKGLLYRGAESVDKGSQLSAEYEVVSIRRRFQ
jgi:hypothetical protein